MREFLRLAGILGCLAMIFAQAAYSTVPDGGLNLPEVYRAALGKTESVAIQGYSAMQAEERLKQAKGTILPSVALNGNYTRQQEQTTGANAFSRPDQYNARLTLTQPIFHGFREFAANRAATAEARAENALTEQAKLNLYASVSDAYFSVLAAEKDSEDLRVQRELTEKRVKELTERVRIGRSRKGELLSAQSQMAVAGAELEAAEATIAQARERFALATGLPRSASLLDPKGALPSLKPAAEYHSRVGTRPDVRAARDSLEAAEQRVAVARGEHLPTLDFTGNYYLKRTGVLEDTKWDIGLVASLPLFRGGIISSLVREAADGRKAAELSLALTERTAAQEISAAYENASRLAKRIRALEDSVTLSEKSYQEQLRDFRYGLATHLDVLQALDAQTESRRALDRASYQARAAISTLDAASGSIPVGP